MDTASPPPQQQVVSVYVDGANALGSAIESYHVSVHDANDFADGHEHGVRIAYVTTPPSEAYGRDVGTLEVRHNNNTRQRRRTPLRESSP